MKKIPTMFERDWNGDKSKVLPQIHKGCEWVLQGEGIATKKIDGTCCLIKDGKLFKRREVKQGQVVPMDFILADTDAETQKTIGWVPVGDAPDDKYHREAFAKQHLWQDGTYELIGVNVQGNPEKQQANVLIKHGSDQAGELHDVPRDFDGLKEYLFDKDMEGIVFHHPDGRMAKIKKRDFGLERIPKIQVKSA